MSAEVTILVVDDIQANRLALKELLRAPGREILEADSGMAALRLLRRQVVDLILLDVEMPEMDGFETADLIRGSSRLSEVPIIFQTAHSTGDRVMKGYGIGAVDFISKPIVPEILRARVGVFLELNRRAAELRSQATELQEANDRLAGSEARIRSILETANDGIIMVNDSGTLEMANPAAHWMFGYEPGSLAGMAAAQMLTRSDSAEPVFGGGGENALVGTTSEVVGHRPDGSEFPVGLSVGRVESAAGGNFSATLRDLTESKAMEARLRHLAHFDPLTGLANRTTLTDRLDLFLKQFRRYRSIGVLFFIDLDGFKDVNDRRGHGVGDQLLVSVAARLKESFRETDMVARIGGDEFCVLTDHLPEGRQIEQQIEQLAERIVEALGEPYSIGGEQVEISASVGVAVPQGSDTVESLLARADAEMYRAKRSGGNRVSLSGTGGATAGVEPAVQS